MVNWASALREELSERAKYFATAKGLIYYESLGASRTVLFPGDAATSRHGNLNDDSYAAILAHAKWAERLKKPHSQRRALPPDRRDDAMELDSSNSSDALLMNCFCYPGAAVRILQECLPSMPTGQVEFGVAGKAPLRDGAFDKTELDMRAGKVIFESKLTEADFTSKRRKVVEAYRDLLDVFDAGLLPRAEDEYQSYQLIRNVLAAAAYGYHFVLLCDGRRPDLLHQWWEVHAAIKNPDLRARTHFLLWQEVAEACPAPLREFLGEKYGLRTGR